jgi:hypothetical protein
MRSRISLILVAAACCLIPQSLAAQVAVTDPAVTLRNTITAFTKQQLVNTQLAQYEQLRRMARRLSALASLSRYAAADVPLWRIHDFENPDVFLYARSYLAALNYGDSGGSEYARVSRRRDAADAALAQLSPGAAAVVRQMLATIDVTDSAATASTHQTGTLRYNGRAELRAINALESHVIDPSSEQSTAAVADKISGAILIGARQRQARIQLLTATLDQLLIDNKRARDTEAALMNMRLVALRDGRRVNAALSAGARDDLQTWRQP